MVNANISTSNDDAQFDEDFSATWERMWMNPPEPGPEDIAKAALEAFYEKQDAEFKAQCAFERKLFPFGTPLDVCHQSFYENMHLFAA